jgi:D-glycero-D-manno-heptose 1,7-bisphosphate phosphatase
MFRSGAGTPAVFLDRDGVVIEETGYLCRVEDIRYLGGAEESILALNRAGIPVILVTNQAGVGRGYYTWSEFEAVQEALETKLNESGAWLDAVWACAYHPDALEPYRAANHTHRKPNPGMLLDAAGRMGLNLNESWMVGDKICDLEAGLSAGVGAAVHVETGYGKELREKAEKHFRGNGRIRFCTDLSEATSYILSTRLTKTINGKT